MKILLAAAEVSPFAKIGGLADMTAALPKAWKAAGHDVVVFLPLYATIDKERFGLQKLPLLVDVPFGSWTEYATVWKGMLPGTDVPVYFVASSDYYERPGIYGYHEGFQDNDRRFIFLSRAAFEVCRAIDFAPDVIHAHDYHTATMMPMLKVLYRQDPLFCTTAGVYTIHNMAYQGMFDPARAMEFCGFDPAEWYTGSWYEYEGAFNAMKAGIMFADKITTVSPTYAEEIRWTPEGHGMQSALQVRGGDLIGVLNGIDPDEWNPETDEHLPVRYSASQIDRKEANKQALLRMFQLPDDERQRDIPVIGMVTRLTEQKGIMLITQVIESFLQDGECRFVLLGSGESRFENYFKDLAYRYPYHALIKTGYDTALSHMIQAASDYYLMPSKFEPCGLTQMFALTYGAVPIVRATGGLADTVQQYDPITFSGNGFMFQRLMADDLHASMTDALRTYKREPHWTSLRINAMAQDFSIAGTAQRYIDVFGWAQQSRR
ncbi:MAG: glycogen synthase [Candidatus Kapabacteria bacterium]|nr:glycogen synthase [Candidatus Kapabacteria bacterium]